MIESLPEELADRSTKREWLQSSLGPVHAMAGLRVRTSSMLRWDQVFISKEHQVVLCGELDHVRYQLEKSLIKTAMRLDLEKTLARFADRVGVEYAGPGTTNTTTNRN